MKEKIKRIVKKYPILEKYSRLLMSGKITNGLLKKKIKGKNNIVDYDKTVMFNNCLLDIIGSNNRIEVDKSTLMNNVTFFIRGNNNIIKIGTKVKFNSGGSIWIEDFNCEVIIGENSTFEDTHIAVTEPNSKIIIGKDCMFAYDIDLRTGDSHSIIDTVTNERINYAKNIRIGDHVWIAAHVSILKGVQITHDSVVATRAVVTKSFDKSNILIGGMPAKILKENINWNRKRIYK